MPDCRFCGYCRYLVPKEYQQTNGKEPHICTKYEKQVKHLGFHPQLPRLEECIKNDSQRVL